MRELRLRRGVSQKSLALETGIARSYMAAAQRIRQVLREDGTWLLVEPFAGDALEDNLNPVGRLFYGISTALCTSHGVSEGDDDCLGAQAGLGRLPKVAVDAGFTRVRLVAQTPFNLVIEVRP